MSWLAELRGRARRLRTEALALYLAARHPSTPWYAKLLVAAIVAYAFSPIDLIPDFIPVLGILDDLIILPAGIVLAIRLVPATVLDECRRRAHAAFRDGRPVSRVAATVIVLIWLTLAALSIIWVSQALAVPGPDAPIRPMQ